MITFILAWVGGMLGALFINYVLHEPNKIIEDYEYKNSGHIGENND